MRPFPHSCGSNDDESVSNPCQLVYVCGTAQFNRTIEKQLHSIGFTGRVVVFDALSHNDL